MLDEVFKTGLKNEARSSATGFTNEEQTTDEQLVYLVLDGDEQAFAEIFERYKRLVTGVVGRFFRDRFEIEECVQQSFAKTYFSLKDFRGGSFPGWITRIAVNVCYDEFRRRGRKPASLFSEIDDGTGLESVSDNEAASAETQVISAQLAEKILATLDPKDRVAMTLVYSQDYSLNDAAEIVGITPSNLKTRLFRCRNHIRDKFGHLFK